MGGAERYVLELARHMANETPTSLVTFGKTDSHEAVGLLRIDVIGHPAYIKDQRSNPFSFKVLKYLRNADIVHCHQQHIVASSFAALFCRISGRKVFVTDLGGGGWDISGYISTDRWYSGHLHISEYSRRVFGHQNQPWSHVIMGGVDAEKFSPARSSAISEKVLFVGRLLPHKGVDDLIDAMPASLPLEIIGPPCNGGFLGDLKQLALGKRVTFRHHCSDEELIEAYRACICIVLPSVYRTRYGEESAVPELLGQTLLEGMACGRPAVCTDVASLPEVVENGVTGFVVPPNSPLSLRDKIVWLRDHPDAATAMGWAGRRRILERFAWPVVVQRCLDAYFSSTSVSQDNDARRTR